MEELLEKDVDEIKEEVEEKEIEFIEELMEVEREGEDREELLEWLEEKKHRLELMEDEQRHEDLLSHLEYAYRTAAISEETYQDMKDKAREVVEG